MQDVNDLLNENNENNDNENLLNLNLNNNVDQYEQLIQDVINEFRKSHVDIKIQKEEIEHIIENFEKKNYELKKLNDKMRNEYTEVTEYTFDSLDTDKILSSENLIQDNKKHNKYKINNSENYQIIKFDPIIDNILQQNDIQIKLKKYYETKQYNRDVKSHIKMDQIIKYMSDMNDACMTIGEINNKSSHLNYYK